MSVLSIKTNNVPRDVLYGFALSDKERAEFDYLSDEDFADHPFFRFKGQVYDLCEYMPAVGELLEKGWQGYSSDSYFSGTVIRYTNDHDSVVVGTYFS